MKGRLEDTASCKCEMRPTILRPPLDSLASKVFSRAGISQDYVDEERHPEVVELGSEAGGRRIGRASMPTRGCLIVQQRVVPQQAQTWRGGHGGPCRAGGHPSKGPNRILLAQPAGDGAHQPGHSSGKPTVLQRERANSKRPSFAFF